MAREFIRKFLSLDDVRITTRDGEDICQWVRSLTYNAAISAFEIRAVRPEETTARMLPDLTSRGPLLVTDKADKALFRIHYEAVTYIPIELSSRDDAATEVHILRSARAEVA